MLNGQLVGGACRSDPAVEREVELLLEPYIKSNDWEVRHGRRQPMPKRSRGLSRSGCWWIMLLGGVVGACAGRAVAAGPEERRQGRTTLPQRLVRMYYRTG